MRRPPEPTNPEPDSAQIKAALKQILASDKFMAAPQMSAFLSYVVEQVINGERKRIKAYTVAVDALGKPQTFDPQNDPVVRVLAGRLRASLSAYYETNPDTDVYIKMKPGSYVPLFLNHAATHENLVSQSNKACSKAIAPAVAFIELKTENSAPTQTTSAKQAKHTPTLNVDFSYRISSLLRFPTVGLALITLALGIAFLATRQPDVQTTEQPIATASDPIHSVDRPRPEQVTIFVSAGSDDSLREQLNTIISDLFLVSSDLQVHRKFDEVNTGRYWPEDYLVSLDVLPLPSETRISVQLIEAQTGRIIHSDILLLSVNADKSLTRKEISKMQKLANQLSGHDGPLLLDYRSKLVLTDASNH